MGTVALACRLWTWCPLPAVMVRKACPSLLSPQTIATVLTEGEGAKLCFHHGTRSTYGGAWEVLLYPILLTCGSCPSALLV